MQNKKLNLMSKFINILEKTGNKLPHPFMLFIYLIIITMISSWILSKFHVSVSFLEGAKTLGMESKIKEVEVVNLLSRENLKYLFVKFPDIIINYAPLKLVLMMMVATAFIDKTGFLEVFMKKYLLKAPKSLITFAVVFMAINSNLMSNAGTIFSLTMGGIIFLALGRNPLIGTILGFVGSSGGFTANLFLSGTDALLAGITENVLNTKNIAINPMMNYFFMATSTIVISIVLTIFTEKVIVKIVGDNKNDENKILLEKHKLKETQEKGLRWAFYGFIIFMIFFLFLVIPNNAFLRNENNSFLPKSPLFNGIITLISILFLMLGIPYGVATNKIKKVNDIPKIISSGLTAAIPFIVTTIPAAIFIELLGKSNIFKILAILGAGFLKTSNTSALSLCIIVMIITTIINPFMPSGSAKWLILAPMVVPLFSILNIHPAYAQLAYRIGDSCTNIISPLNSELPIIIGLLVDYQKNGDIPPRPGEKVNSEIGIGTIFSLTIPYSIVLLLTMSIMLIIWIIFELPIGPGISLYI